MIKLKHFKHEESKEFNDFAESHPPRSTKDANGILLTVGGIYLVYEDGEPLTPAEQVANLLEVIRGKRTEIINAEPDYRMKVKSIAVLKKEISKLEKQIEESESKNSTTKEARLELKKLEEDLELKKATLEQTENFILVTDGNRKNAKEKIEAVKQVIEDIQSGKFVI